MNPIESGQYELIRINPNFKSEWIWSIRINSHFQIEWIQSIRSIRTFNPIQSHLSESIRLTLKNSVSFGLMGLIRIVSSDLFWRGLWLIWIEKFLQIRSEWNCLVRIQIPEWFGKFRIGSEWISIRNFRQGHFREDSGYSSGLPYQ